MRWESAATAITVYGFMLYVSNESRDACHTVSCNKELGQIKACSHKTATSVLPYKVQQRAKRRSFYEALKCFRILKYILILEQLEITRGKAKNTDNLSGIFFSDIKTATSAFFRAYLKTKQIYTIALKAWRIQEKNEEIRECFKLFGHVKRPKSVEIVRFADCQTAQIRSAIPKHDLFTHKKSCIILIPFKTVRSVFRGQSLLKPGISRQIKALPHTDLLMPIQCKHVINGT